MIQKIELELKDGRILVMAERINGKLVKYPANIPVWHKTTAEDKKKGKRK